MVEFNKFATGVDDLSLISVALMWFQFNFHLQVSVEFKDLIRDLLWEILNPGMGFNLAFLRFSAFPFDWWSCTASLAFALFFFMLQNHERRLVKPT